MDDVYVVGADTIKFGKYLDKSIKDLTAWTVTGCLEDAGMEKKDIQAICFSNSGWGDQGQSCIRGQVALRPMGINAIPITNVENACAGASTAFHHAWMGVASGLYDVTMAIGAEKLYNENKLAVFAGFIGGMDVDNIVQMLEEITDFQMTDDDYKQMKEFTEKYKSSSIKPAKKSKRKRDPPWKRVRDAFVVSVMLGEKLGRDTLWKIVKASRESGVGERSPFMDAYAHMARQHMKKYGSTIEQLAVIASKNHFNSTLNPNAQYRFEVSVEQVLTDRMVSWPLTRSMCAPIGDGSASAILCSEDVVKKLGLEKQAVRVLASILGSGRREAFDFDEEEIGARLSKQAYKVAGVGPEDINLVEVHDATAYGELRQAENLGFCDDGEGGILAQKGETKLDGSIPINTSGGLTSRGHPIGASGLAQIHELVTQLRGRAGKRQVKNPKLAMAENGGGALGSEEAAMCMHILEAPPK